MRIRKQVTPWIICVAFAFSASPTATRAQEPAPRPNIVFILTDDQSPFDLRVYDSESTLETPVLDQLAQEGMVFDGAYHMGSFVSAVCTPSRHMIMSGRSLWHIPGSPEATRYAPSDLAQHTLGAVFNQAGYDTMRTCKKGNSYQAANEQFGINRTKDGRDPDGSRWHADQVLDFLKSRKTAAAKKPFLIYFGLSHPHDPRNGKPELVRKYGAHNETVPPVADPKSPKLQINYLAKHPFHFRVPDARDETRVQGVMENRDEATIRNELGRYYACIEEIDTQIGRVLEELEAQGELDHTYVVFTADHGIAVGRHGLQGKQNLYQHSWRVPLIVKGPGVTSGSRVNGNVYLMDLLATFCDLAGIDPPETNEGLSFKPVLEGKTPNVRDVMYGAFSGDSKPGLRCVKKGDWKLIEYEILESQELGGQPVHVRESQLFNLADNPFELLDEHQWTETVRLTGNRPSPRQTNLAHLPEYAAKLREMRALLSSEQQQWDDPYHFSNQP